MTVACLANENIDVVRWGKSRLVGGKAKASKQPPFKAVAAVQAVGGRERETLPEGRRQSYVIKLYTEIKLLIDDDQQKQRADLVRIDGEWFEVFQVERFKGIGMDHYRSFAARLNQ